MVPQLARMAVVIKAEHEENIITGNYEMAYICGLLCALSGAVPPGPGSAGDMHAFVTSRVLPDYEPKDDREKNVIRMLKLYKTDDTFDEQVKELFAMGLNEKKPWMR